MNSQRCEFTLVFYLIMSLYLYVDVGAKIETLVMLGNFFS